MPLATDNVFFIWGIDEAAYGPVELPMLVDWVRDERVLADTWIYSRLNSNWIRAVELPELKMFFGPKGQPSAQASPGTVSSGALRRIKILAELSDADLQNLAGFLEVLTVPRGTEIARHGEPGDGMFFILEGEVRSRTDAADLDSASILGPGEIFGDVSMFDHGPRSADVTADAECTLLSLSAASFSRLTREYPALAAALLQATAKTHAARIRAETRQLGQLKRQFRVGAA